MDRPLVETPIAELMAAARQLRHASALVVGDAMLDRYVYGRAQRISPEAPVPVLTVEREIAMPGGAGNVVRNLTALGAAVAFVSVVGDDQAGSDLTGLIGGQPGVEPWLLVQSGRATTTKTRFLANGQHMLRADHEEVGPIQQRLADASIEHVGLLSKEKALEELAKLGDLSIRAPEGPVQVGVEKKIVTNDSLKELAAHYHSAFHQGIRCYPYFASQG